MKIFRRLTRRPGGFTLVELILVVALTALLAGVGARLALQGTNSYMAQEVRDDLLTGNRTALERMAREIRGIRSATAADIPVMAATDLQFTDTGGQSLRFTLAGSTLNRNGQALASNVGALAFRYLQANGTSTTADPTLVWFVEISASLSKNGESLPLRLRIHPRNF
jgi:prepilin-type N-terminal cleavage/methylation domain-containing protein